MKLRPHCTESLAPPLVMGFVIYLIQSNTMRGMKASYLVFNGIRCKKLYMLLDNL